MRARSCLRWVLTSLRGPAWPGAAGFAAVGEQGGDGLLAGYGFALDFGAGLSGAVGQFRIVLRAGDMLGDGGLDLIGDGALAQLGDEAQLGVDVRLEFDA